MTVTHEILASLVAVDLFIMGINIKFLFALWNDLKLHKVKTDEEIKEIRENQSGVEINFERGCRVSQKGCAESIRSYIKEESSLAKNEAKVIALELRDAGRITAKEIKETEEARYKEFKMYGIELRRQLYQHTHDDEGKAVIK